MGRARTADFQLSIESLIRRIELYAATNSFWGNGGKARPVRYLGLSTIVELAMARNQNISDSRDGEVASPKGC